jgi:hypothetical protein
MSQDSLAFGNLSPKVTDSTYLRELKRDLDFTINCYCMNHLVSGGSFEQLYRLWFMPKYGLFRTDAFTVMIVQANLFPVE